jgi:hypothetical protein
MCLWLHIAHRHILIARDCNFENIVFYFIVKTTHFNNFEKLQEREVKHLDLFAVFPTAAI